MNDQESEHESKKGHALITPFRCILPNTVILN